MRLARWARKSVRSTVRIVLVLSVSAVTAATLSAARIVIENPFNLYGDVQNVVCPTAPDGVCAAAAAISSFKYLENRYSTVYPANSLIPGGNLASARDDFAVN